MNTNIIKQTKVNHSSTQQKANEVNYQNSKQVQRSSYRWRSFHSFDDIVHRRRNSTHRLIIFIEIDKPFITLFFFYDDHL